MGELDQLGIECLFCSLEMCIPKNMKGKELPRQGESEYNALNCPPYTDWILRKSDQSDLQVEVGPWVVCPIVKYWSQNAEHGGIINQTLLHKP